MWYSYSGGDIHFDRMPLASLSDIPSDLSTVDCATAQTEQHCTSAAAEASGCVWRPVAGEPAEAPPCRDTNTYPAPQGPPFSCTSYLGRPLGGVVWGVEWRECALSAVDHMAGWIPLLVLDSNLGFLSPSECQHMTHAMRRPRSRSVPYPATQHSTALLSGWRVSIRT